MAKGRKTFSVEKFKKYVNDFCLHSADNKQQAREYLGLYLEKILVETNNYKGFNYLTREMMKNSREGLSIGMNDLTLPYEERFENTDYTRIYYY